MQKRTLGQTGLEISPIGLGTVKFGRDQALKYPNSFTIPNDQEVVALLSYAQELGINLLDTAPAYGNSEERLGALLGKSRNNWIIVSKVGEEFINGESLYNFTKEHTIMSVERSLKRLKTDYLDVILVHSDGNDAYNIENFGIFDCLSDLKQKGLIRAFGMSTKTIEGGLLTIKHADVAMITHNPIHTNEQPVIAEAYKTNKGILIKKALASGHIQKIPGQDPISTSLNFIFQEPGVSSVIVGTINREHLAHAVDCVNNINEI